MLLEEFDRIVASIVPNKNGCKIWPGTEGQNIRGHFRVNVTGLGQTSKKVWVHRLALSQHLGRPIERGKLVCHTCDERGCVTVGHLYEGTAKDNSQDVVKRGRWWSAVRRKRFWRKAITIKYPATTEHRPASELIEYWERKWEELDKFKSLRPSSIKQR